VDKGVPDVQHQDAQWPEMLVPTPRRCSDDRLLEPLPDTQDRAEIGVGLGLRSAPFLGRAGDDVVAHIRHDCDGLALAMLRFSRERQPDQDGVIANRGFIRASPSKLADTSIRHLEPDGLGPNTSRGDLHSPLLDLWAST
jgi:hypothetical protein